jgi:hypothetical protein
MISRGRPIDQIALRVLLPTALMAITTAGVTHNKSVNPFGSRLLGVRPPRRKLQENDTVRRCGFWNRRKVNKSGNRAGEVRKRALIDYYNSIRDRKLAAIVSFATLTDQ